jgi:hypothetical protein
VVTLLGVQQQTNTAVKTIMQKRSMKDEISAKVTGF